MQNLEVKWKKALVDADEFRQLENRLKEVTQSSNLDKQNALDRLHQELQDTFQKDRIALSLSHEKELNDLRTNHLEELDKLKGSYESQIHGLSQFKLREELRLIKSGFEKDKQDAINRVIEAAIAHTNEMRTKLRLPLNSLQHGVYLMDTELEEANIIPYNNTSGSKNPTSRHYLTAGFEELFSLTADGEKANPTL